MKKNTMIAIAAALNTVDFENKDAIMAEISAELNKGAEIKAMKNAEYESVKDIILNGLSETPATITELYESIKDALPENFSKSRVQYAVTRLFTDEIVKIEGKPNTYRKA